jgi:magnesium-transporting ATPase (P-type)
VRIIDALFLQRVLIMGLMIALPSFLVYHHFGAAAVVDGVVVDAHLLTQAQTAAFWAILMTQLGYLVSARSLFASAFTSNPLGNPWLLGGIALSVPLAPHRHLCAPGRCGFRLAAFPAEWWPLILLTILPSFVAIEADKLVRAGNVRLPAGLRTGVGRTANVAA